MISASYVFIIRANCQVSLEYFEEIWIRFDLCLLSKQIVNFLLEYFEKIWICSWSRQALCLLSKQIVKFLLESRFWNILLGESETSNFILVDIVEIHLWVILITPWFEIELWLPLLRPQLWKTKYTSHTSSKGQKIMDEKNSSSELRKKIKTCHFVCP